VTAAASLGALTPAEAAPRLVEAREGVAAARQLAPPFLPNIAAGRARMEALWEAAHSGAGAPAGGDA